MGGFYAIHVDGDGNCLAHAVSRCLYQSEIYWHALRTELQKELIDNREFYHAQFAEAMGETVDQELDDAIREAGPTQQQMPKLLTPEEEGLVNELVDLGFEHSKAKNAVQSLEGELNIELAIARIFEAGEGNPFMEAGLQSAGTYMSPLHLFAFANLLQRPVVLLSSREQWSHSNAGVYLPVRHAPERCVDAYGHARSPLFIAWADPELQHYVAVWPVFQDDQDCIVVPPESLPRDEHGELLVYGNATEAEVEGYLQEGRWEIRNSEKYPQTERTLSVQELHDRWKEMHGMSWMKEWEKQQMAYSTQVLLMDRISKVFQGDTKTHDPAVVKKLVFQDDSFVYMTHALYQFLSQAAPNKQRRIVARLHSFSRFVGTSRGCGALQRDESGELAAEFEQMEQEPEQMMAPSPFAGMADGTPALTWEMQSFGKWKPMRQDVQQKLNHSIASGEAHPIVISVGADQFEFDAYTGYMESKSDEPVQSDQVDQLSALLGFARNLSSTQRTPIRTVAKLDTGSDLSSRLRQMGFDPAMVAMMEGMAGGKLKLADDKDSASPQNQQVAESEVDGLLEKAGQMGFNRTQCRRALESTQSSQAAFEYGAADAAMEWLFEYGGDVTEEEEEPDQAREEGEAAGSEPAVPVNSVPKELQQAAALSIEGATNPEAPSSAAELSEALSADCQEQTPASRQEVCEVYEGPDGLLTHSTPKRLEELMANQPLWVRQLALHHTWSKRFDKLSAGEPAGLVRVSSFNQPGSTPGEQGDTVPASLVRTQSCPPEPGSLAAAAASSNVEHARTQALELLFSQERAAAQPWCPFSN
eukprot:TRINITY_DN25925_c0_g3_i2.p1 TRINITY_DN25925_c0_g3~~TRINITY_DN25925_c0_g3_i2.p1  ORF type:complete len:814 (-),score=200.81 TRINITY_DN25925_c0_g3_i2:417-2858(-)